MHRLGSFFCRVKATTALTIVTASAALGLVAFGIKNHFRQSYRPKKAVYVNIDLPKQHYQPLEGDFPYQFEYSIHAHILDCKSRYRKDYWIDIYYPDFDATIYISYESVSGRAAILEKLCKNASILAFQHQVKASCIEESIIKTPKGYQATVIELFGEVPTPFQFYTTDGAKHFLRGALYFNTTLQNDFSVIDFLKKDIIHMLHTLEWKA